MKLINWMRYYSTDDQNFKNKVHEVLNKISNIQNADVKKQIIKNLDECIETYPDYYQLPQIMLHTLNYCEESILNKNMFLYDIPHIINVHNKSTNSRKVIFLSLLADEKGVCKEYDLDYYTWMMNYKYPKLLEYLKDLHRVGLNSSNIRCILDTLPDARFLNSVHIYDNIFNIIVSYCKRWQSIDINNNIKEFVDFLKQIVYTLSDKDILERTPILDMIANNMSNIQTIRGLENIKRYLVYTDQIDINRFKEYLSLFSYNNIRNNIIELVIDNEYLLNDEYQIILNKIIDFENWAYFYSTSTDNITVLNRVHSYIKLILTNDRFAYNRFELLEILTDMKNYSMFRCLVDNIENYVGVKGDILNNRISLDLQMFFNSKEKELGNDNYSVMKRLLQLNKN